MKLHFPNPRQKVLKFCVPDTCVDVSLIFVEFYVVLQSPDVRVASIIDNDVEHVIVAQASCVVFYAQVFCPSVIYSEHRMDLPDQLPHYAPPIEDLLFEH